MYDYTITTMALNELNCPKFLLYTLYKGTVVCHQQYLLQILPTAQINRKGYSSLLGPNIPLRILPSTTLPDFEIVQFRIILRTTRILI